MVSGDSQQSDGFSTNVGGLGIEPYMFEPEYDSDEMAANQGQSAGQTSPDLPTPTITPGVDVDLFSDCIVQ